MVNRYEIDLQYDNHGNPVNFRVNNDEGEWVLWYNVKDQTEAYESYIKYLEGYINDNSGGEWL